MTLDYKGDTAYDACINTLWGFAEMTGVMVVFCAPTLPKVFSGPGTFTRLVSTLRTWSRIPESSVQNLNKSSAAATWPHSAGHRVGSHEQNTSNVEREDENELIYLTAFESHNNTQRMTEMSHNREILSKGSADSMLEK